MPATPQPCVNADYFSLINVNRQPCSPEYEVPFLMRNSRRKIKPKTPQQKGQCRMVMRSTETVFEFVNDLGHISLSQPMSTLQAATSLGSLVSWAGITRATKG